MIYYRVKPERDTYTHTGPVNISPKETYWFFWGKVSKLGGITTMSKWEIMQRVADTRKEIETFAQDWADVPGGTRNPLAVADWERLWRQLDELFAELRGCAVA